MNKKYFIIIFLIIIFLIIILLFKNLIIKKEYNQNTYGVGLESEFGGGLSTPNRQSGER